MIQEAMIGRPAFDKSPQELSPCEWTIFHSVWYAKTPNGLLVSLRKQTVIHYTDDTITVIGIIHANDFPERQWHGFLRDGNWREA